jgi:hypothetical protein
MPFAHSFGLLHGHLTGDNVVFDDGGLIQVCDFCVKSLSEVGANSEAIDEVGGQLQLSEDSQNFFQRLSLMILLRNAIAVYLFRHLFWR